MDRGLKVWGGDDLEPVSRRLLSRLQMQSNGQALRIFVGALPAALAEDLHLGGWSGTGSGVLPSNTF